MISGYHNTDKINEQDRYDHREHEAYGRSVGNFSLIVIAPIALYLTLRLVEMNNEYSRALSGNFMDDNTPKGAKAKLVMNTANLLLIAIQDLV